METNLLIARRKFDTFRKAWSIMVNDFGCEIECIITDRNVAKDFYEVKIKCETGLVLFELGRVYQRIIDEETEDSYSISLSDC